MQVSNRPQHVCPHSLWIPTPHYDQMAVKCKCFLAERKVWWEACEPPVWLHLQIWLKSARRKKKEVCTDPESCSLIRELKVCRVGVSETLILCLALSSTQITPPSARRSTSPFQQYVFFLYLREKKYLTSSTNRACHWASNDSAVSSKTWPQTMTNGWSGTPAMRSYGPSLTLYDTFVLRAFVIQAAGVMDWILKRGCQCISEKVLIW